MNPKCASFVLRLRCTDVTKFDGYNEIFKGDHDQFLWLCAAHQGRRMRRNVMDMTKFGAKPKTFVAASSTVRSQSEVSIDRCFLQQSACANQEEYTYMFLLLSIHVVSLMRLFQDPVHNVIVKAIKVLHPLEVLNISHFLSVVCCRRLPPCCTVQQVPSGTRDIFASSHRTTVLLFTQDSRSNSLVLQEGTPHEASKCLLHRGKTRQTCPHERERIN